MSYYSLLLDAASDDQRNWLYGQFRERLGALSDRDRIELKGAEENRRVEIDGLDAAVRPTICDVISEYVIDFAESGWVRQWIAKEYHFNDPEEVDGIEKYYRHESGPTRDQRKKRLSRALSVCLEENEAFHLGGFLRFRLGEYRDELRGMVECAIDEHLMEKQYQEFISLLQYFIYLQEAKIPLAHLIHQGGHRFVLLDDKMKPIETEQLEAVHPGDAAPDFHFEDIIVSTLITVSPQKIYIHTRNPEMQVIQTIRQIFENRTTLCTHCPRCMRMYGVKKRLPGPRPADS